MNILGPPVDNEARGMIGELVSMGNPFKARDDSCEHAMVESWVLDLHGS